MIQDIKKKTVFLIFDALPYEQFYNYGYKYVPNINKEKVIKLESLIGYSGGLYPSIWTGLYPDKVNLWSEFKFIYQKYNDLKELDKSIIFDKVLSLISYLPRLLSQFSSLGLFLLSFKFNLFPFNYPVCFDFRLKKYFKFEDYHEYIFYPENTLNKEHITLFSLLRENKISFKFIETTQYIADFTKFNEDIIFYYNPILDVVGHKYGPNSKAYNEILKKSFIWIDKIISKFNCNIVLFSDHGMTTVNRKFFPLKILKNLSLKLYQDLFVWLDSTMMRIWLISRKSIKMKSNIIKTLEKFKVGHFLTEIEKKKYGLNFKNRFFGDLIFMVDPHYEIFPNFFNIIPFRLTKGLHGYIPTHKSSYGVFYSNFINYQEPLSIIDLYKIFITNLIS